MMWRPVVGYEGIYEVSDAGEVRSVPRVDTGGNRRKGRPIKQATDRKGYVRVTLHWAGRGMTKKVHHLVLEAFVGPRPPGAEGCHNDGRKGNNAVTNLRWDTASANALDNVRLGVHPQARKTHCPSGHPYNPENTLHGTVGTGNSRSCRACSRARTAAYRRRLRAKAA